VIGRPDRSLTSASGLTAVAELDARLAITATLDEHIEPIKRRDRGLSAGLARRFGPAQLTGIETAIGQVAAILVVLSPAANRSAARIRTAWRRCHAAAFNPPPCPYLITPAYRSNRPLSAPATNH
jgi:hypothetical protein